MTSHLKITVLALMLCLTGQLFAQREKEIKNSEVKDYILHIPTSRTAN
jgi:hypothetical protein